MQSTDTTLQPQHMTSPTAVSGRSLVDQQAMDQFTQIKHAVIIPFPKAGDYNTYNLLQLPGVRSGGIRGERLSDIWKQGCQALKHHSKQGRRTWSSAPAATATNTFTKLQCNFNICVTNISTAT